MPNEKLKKLTHNEHVLKTKLTADKVQYLSQKEKETKI